MKRRLIAVTAFFAALICILTGIFYYAQTRSDAEEARSEQLVALNEIEKLAQSGDLAELSGKTAALAKSLTASSDGNGLPWALCALCVVFLMIVFGYVYLQILRPFERMKSFAGRIAAGNFDLPLDYGRSDYFGEFTWAFDSMRREITKARACEKEAVDNNKTVIATLSHDIKTPIASIRAYAEGLEANLDATPEKRAKYLGVLMRKCDEVSKLTNDLFLHSLADLDKLRMTPERFELCALIEDTIGEFAAERNDIRFVKPAFTAMVYADRNRMIQIAENLINNARKYAKSRIDVYLTQTDRHVAVHFCDFGAGIPDEDMPFIYDKFYRGQNCGGEYGSGLGLYIVKYIVGQMDGDILLHNRSDGLEAVVSLPLVFPNS